MTWILWCGYFFYNIIYTSDTQKQLILNRVCSWIMHKSIKTNHCCIVHDSEVEHIFFHPVTVGTSEFHRKIYVRLNICICHMKRSIKNFCSPYATINNARFVHKKIMKPKIYNSLRCYIETSTSTSIKNLLRDRPRFAYIL